MGIGWNAPQTEAHAVLLLISFGFSGIYSPKACRYTPSSLEVPPSAVMTASGLHPACFPTASTGRSASALRRTCRCRAPR